MPIEIKIVPLVTQNGVQITATDPNTLLKISSTIIKYFSDQTGNSYVAKSEYAGTFQTPHLQYAIRHTLDNMYYRFAHQSTTTIAQELEAQIRENIDKFELKN